MSLRKLFTGKPGNLKELVREAPNDLPIEITIIGDSIFDPPACPYSKFGYATISASIQEQKVTVKKSLKGHSWEPNQKQFMELLRKKAQKIFGYIKSQGKSYKVKEKYVFTHG